MTPRATLHALLERDVARSRKDIEDQLLEYKEFDAIGWFLIGRPLDARTKDTLKNMLIRNRETDGAFLTDDEDAALLHVINGGSIDDALGTDTRCVVANHPRGGEPVVFHRGDAATA